MVQVTSLLIRKHLLLLFFFWKWRKLQYVWVLGLFIKIYIQIFIYVLKLEKETTQVHFILSNIQKIICQKKYVNLYE